jgi:hypothetical protein
MVVMRRVARSAARRYAVEDVIGLAASRDQRAHPFEPLHQCLAAVRAMRAMLGGQSGVLGLKVLPEGFSSNRYGKGRRLWRCRNWKIYASDAFEGLARNC